jgi:hypothetical protein
VSPSSKLNRERSPDALAYAPVDKPRAKKRRARKPRLSSTKTNGERRLPPSRVILANSAFIARFKRHSIEDPDAEATNTSPCLLWYRKTKKNGYAQVSIRYQGMEWTLQAHRVAWMLAHGRWPSRKFDVDHICGRRNCVNPDHLRQRRPELNRKTKYAPRLKNYSWKNQWGQG